MGKLNRDGVPDLIRRDGGRVETRRLSDDEFGAALREKIVEEAREVAAAGSRGETIEELADLLEVVRALTGVLVERLVGAGEQEPEVARHRHVDLPALDESPRIPAGTC
jgi:predicted house-cleaning noncanonical NTP pyrophosphatase (MazG superfamily)